MHFRTVGKASGMLAFIPWIAALCLRHSRYQQEQLAAFKCLDDAIRNAAASTMTVDDPANVHAAYVEQSTGNREHDDHVRGLKVAALHEFKRDFARRPIRDA